MKRRGQIKMTPEEQEKFLRGRGKAALATLDKDGFPHIVAMSVLWRDGAFYMSSFEKAQKVINIRRNPKAAVMVETGGSYAELRGVMIRGECEIIEDPATIDAIMRAITIKETGDDSNFLPGRANKRVIIKVAARKIATWDHSKLGGVY